MVGGKEEETMKDSKSEGSFFWWYICAHSLLERIISFVDFHIDFMGVVEKYWGSISLRIYLEVLVLCWNVVIGVMGKLKKKDGGVLP